jgi:hypothetical protein
LKAQFLRSPRIVYVLTGVLAAIVAYGVIAMVLLKDPVPEQGVGAFFGLPPEQNGVPIFNVNRPGFAGDSEPWKRRIHGPGEALVVQAVPA